MAVIVMHKETEHKYHFIGAGYGAFKATRPGLFFGNLFPEEEEGQYPMIAVCDEEGEIKWGVSSDFIVVEIDGRPPSRLG